jgi:hypothetical protein
MLLMRLVMKRTLGELPDKLRRVIDTALKTAISPGLPAFSVDS